jgi:histidine triad (HIT) family protein
MDDCIFCKIIDGKIPSEKVFEDDLVVVIRDVAPVAPIHLLIMSKKHIINSLEVHAEDMEVIGRVFQVATLLARENGVDESGFRIVNNNNAGAGQTVFHLHFHFLAGRRFHWPPG